MIVRKNGQIKLVDDQTTGLSAVVNDAKIFVLFGGATEQAEVAYTRLKMMNISLLNFLPAASFAHLVLET